jgi:cytochrome c peroxidase
MQTSSSRSLPTAPVGVVASLGGLVFVSFLPGLAGCGGKASPSAPSNSVTATAHTPTIAGTGRATLSIQWPLRSDSRLIPLAANSVRVDMVRNGETVATQLVARPVTGTTATLTFDELPTGNLTVRATAYPQTNGTGVAQATGTAPLVVTANEMANFRLVLVSTVDHVDITPATSALTVGQSQTLLATAWDSPGTSGNVVMVFPGSLEWVSTNPAVVTVNSSGGITSVALGNATIRVTDTESGKTATCVVTVTAPAPPDPFAGVKEYTTIDVNNLPNYANPAFPVHYDANILGQNNTPANNQVSDKGATLGRVLFYDKRLSINDTVSCASCHQQDIGFTDGKQFSTGFNGGATTAHGMRLGNIRFYTGLVAFWDKRAASVEAQATQPIQNEIEMGFDSAHGGFGAVTAKMNTLPYYPELFRWVFGDANITEERVQLALAQFERSMVSVNSKFDTGFAQVFNPAAPQRGAGAPFANYTAQEERGKQVFLTPPNAGGAGCVACHSVPTFALAQNSRSNGLDAGETRIFKSPSLKNVAAGGPYMHDGRFATLAQVVEHYNSGIQAGPALDNRLRTPGGQPLRLNLSQADKDALVAFLRTLDDPVLSSDTKFTNPFKK